MRLATAVAAYALLTSSARAFTPSRSPVSLARRVNHLGQLSTRGMLSSADTSLKANVLKLNEPAKDLLPGVDVFIFDCDGVIWRVSVRNCESCACHTSMSQYAYIDNRLREIR